LVHFVELVSIGGHLFASTTSDLANTTSNLMLIFFNFFLLFLHACTKVYRKYLQVSGTTAPCPNRIAGAVDANKATLAATSNYHRTQLTALIYIS
jgi:hypothetical protein